MFSLKHFKSQGTTTRRSTLLEVRSSKNLIQLSVSVSVCQCSKSPLVIHTLPTYATHIKTMTRLTV